MLEPTKKKIYAEFLKGIRLIQPRKRTHAKLSKRNNLEPNNKNDTYKVMEKESF